MSKTQQEGRAMTQETQRSTEAQLMQVQVEVIRPSVTNPRRFFDDGGIDELAASIGQLGIQVPLLVRFCRNPAGDLIPGQYELVSGERRLRAATKLGLNEVPCLLREMSDAEAREIQITENLQRADVHPVEEAEAYRLLIADSAAHGLSRERTAGDLARRLGKSEAHVARRLKLLDLEIDAKLMYAKGHLTLGHAELLARLTAKDQERALRFMLDSDPQHDKRALTEVIGEKLRYRSRDEDGEPVIYPNGSPKIARNMHAGRRLVECTEAQLKAWVASNVLLQLKSAPFHLADETLLPIAGACLDCPKRSGSNAALFGDLTVEDDVCLDPACFAAKQKAFLSWTARTAKAQGRPLAKLSAKPGCDRLPESVPAGKQLPLLRRGQWVAAAAGSCPSVVIGLMRDGKDAGHTLTVCANQGCKVHRHVVEEASASGSGQRPGESWEARSAREQAERQVLEEKQAAYELEELPVRTAVWAACLAKVELSAWVEEMRWQLVSHAEETADAEQAMKMLGLWTAGGEAKRYGQAARELVAYLKTASGADLLRVATTFRNAQALQMGSVEAAGGQRKPLWKLAKAHGVNPDAIAKGLQGKAVAGAKAAAKTAVKAAATSGGKAAKPTPRKVLSVEARKRVAEAMKKRWAARRKAVTA